MAKSLDCRAYWGSHGCELERGHAGHHECDCCECADHAANALDKDAALCVGKFPYYGDDTNFYGQDAA